MFHLFWDVHRKRHKRHCVFRYQAQLLGRACAVACSESQICTGSNRLDSTRGLFNGTAAEGRGGLVEEEEEERPIDSLPLSWESRLFSLSTGEDVPETSLHTLCLPRSVVGTTNLAADQRHRARRWSRGGRVHAVKGGFSIL